MPDGLDGSSGVSLSSQRFAIVPVPPGPGGTDCCCVQRLAAVNSSMHEELDKFKDGISKHHRNKKWDRFKKLCNDHELVFTSSPDMPSIAAACPVSRSFFKFWETAHEFADVLRLRREAPVRAVFVAEGPGGFVEAFCEYRQSIPGDALFGMTLLSPNKSVPEWKLGASELHGKPFRALAGSDGSGSLYSVPNINALVAAVGAGSADLVTADGGFDFSGNFNQQESISLRLIAAEALVALRVQKPGGCFLLKVYDLRLPQTLAVLAILARSYGGIHVTKPLSSRPANSEKYLVCSCFTGASQSDVDLLTRAVSSGDDRLLAASQAASTLMHAVIRVNQHFIRRQIACIDGTLRCIAEHDAASDDERKARLQALLNQQVRASLAWCERYGVGVSAEARQRYGIHQAG